MGSTFAVAIAQQVTSAVLRSAGLPPPSPFSFLLDSRLRKVSTTTLPYIDDINIFGTSGAADKGARDHVETSFDKVRFPTEPSKHVDVVQGDFSVAIGLAWWCNGVLTFKPDHAKRLFCTKNPIVTSRRASPRVLQHVIELGIGLCYLDARHSPFYFSRLYFYSRGPARQKLSSARLRPD